MSNQSFHQQFKGHTEASIFFSQIIARCLAFIVGLCFAKPTNLPQRMELIIPPPTWQSSRWIWVYNIFPKAKYDDKRNNAGHFSQPLTSLGFWWIRAGILAIDEDRFSQGKKAVPFSILALIFELCRNLYNFLVLLPIWIFQCPVTPVFSPHKHFYSFFPALEEICASSWSDSSLVGRQLGSRSHRSICQGRDLKTYENI